MAGRKINDHSSWIGSGGKDTVLPTGVKMKSESSAVGAGELSEYQDTTDKIKASQEMSINKIKSHPLKSGYRN